MKRLSFLQVGLLAALAVSVASCGVPMGASGDYYEDEPGRGNVYYGSPNTIIVERDPFTGRYYQVSPGLYGNVYGAPVYPYGGRRYNNRSYNNNRNNNNNRNYNSGRSNGQYRTYPQAQQPRQTPEQRQQAEKSREATKESILGKKRN